MQRGVLVVFFADSITAGALEPFTDLARVCRIAFD
jgi:hypothetical protein